MEMVFRYGRYLQAADKGVDLMCGGWASGLELLQNVTQIMDLNGFSGTTHATENIYGI